MFNFTTQTVYNYIDDTENSSKRNMWVPKDNDTKPQLRIGNTRFDEGIIDSIQVKLPTQENLAKITFDIKDIKDKIDAKCQSFDPDITGPVTARFVFYIGLTMNYQDPFYANDLIYKGKPLYIEFQYDPSDDQDTIARKIKDLAKKYILLIQGGREKILNIKTTAYDAGNGNNDAENATITFEAVNGYQIIRKANLQWFNPSVKTVDCCTYTGDYEDLLIGVPVMYTLDYTDGGKIVPKDKVFDGTQNGRDLASNEVAIVAGSEAFCDYNWIIHNLRLPTAANYYPWSPANRMGEIPVPGQVYTQFIITIKKERDGIMGEIVGARGVSVTTHVLYVAGAAALNTSVTTTPADQVYKALNNLASAKIEVVTNNGVTTGKADKVLKDPFKK